MAAGLVDIQATKDDEWNPRIVRRRWLLRNRPAGTCLLDGLSIQVTHDLLQYGTEGPHTRHRQRTTVAVGPRAARVLEHEGGVVADSPGEKFIGIGGQRIRIIIMFAGDDCYSVNGSSGTITRYLTPCGLNENEALIYQQLRKDGQNAVHALIAARACLAA